MGGQKGEEALAFEYPNARGHNSFGWGRRACSGQPLAEQSHLMALTRMLWAFKIQPGLDENVSTRVSFGGLHTPLYFMVSLISPCLDVRPISLAF